MVDFHQDKSLQLDKSHLGRYPPGPKGIPLLGNLLQARSDPLQFAQDLIKKYGDIVRFRIGFFTGYLINSPEYVRQVLSFNNRNYNKQNYNYRKLKPVLGDGLITSDGDHWELQRRLIQPIFHHSHLSSFADITTKTTNQLLNDWTLLLKSGKLSLRLTRLFVLP